MPRNSSTSELNFGLLDQSPTAVATANGGTIDTSVDVTRVSPAAAVTGVILAKGRFVGQEAIIINEAIAANSITFAAAGTSNVSDGVADVIPGVTARAYIWDTATQLWYVEK